MYRLSPIATLLATQHSLSKSVLGGLKGTGPQGLIMKSDILDYTLGRVSVSPVQPVSQQSVPPQKIDPVQVVSQESDYLLSKQSIPHYHLNIKVDLAPLLSFQSRVVAQLQSDIGVDAFLIKAIANSLCHHRVMNSRYGGHSIQEYKQVSLQIDRHDHQGTTTTYLRQADHMGVIDIQEQLDQQTGQAMSCTGCIKFFAQAEQVSEIIDMQHGCVISVGQAQTRVCVSEEGEMMTRSEVNINLGSDHRVIDGAVAATFLQDLQKQIESPSSMML